VNGMPDVSSGGIVGGAVVDTVAVSDALVVISAKSKTVTADLKSIYGDCCIAFGSHSIDRRQRMRLQSLQYCMVVGMDPHTQTMMLAKWSDFISKSSILVHRSRQYAVVRY
jgi:hypothetical protein